MQLVRAASIYRPASQAVIDRTVVWRPVSSAWVASNVHLSCHHLWRLRRPHWPDWQPKCCLSSSTRTTQTAVWLDDKQGLLKGDFGEPSPRTTDLHGRDGREISEQCAICMKTRMQVSGRARSEKARVTPVNYGGRSRAYWTMHLLPRAIPIQPTTLLSFSRKSQRCSSIYRRDATVRCHTGQRRLWWNGAPGQMTKFRS